MLRSSSSIPVYQNTLSGLVEDIVEAPLPAERNLTDIDLVSNYQKLKSPLRSCRSVIICFSDKFNKTTRISAPALDSVRKIARFSNISITFIDIERDLPHIYTALLSVIQGSRDYEKILLYDFLSLFHNSQLKLPLQCFNVKFLMNILNLARKYKSFLHFIESRDSLAQISWDLVPLTPYTDEEKLLRDIDINSAAREKRFRPLSNILHSAGFYSVSNDAGSSPFIIERAT